MEFAKTTFTATLLVDGYDGWLVCGVLFVLSVLVLAVASGYYKYNALMKFSIRYYF